MNTYDYTISDVEIYCDEQLGGDEYNLILPLPRLGTVKVLVEWHKGAVDVRTLNGQWIKRYKYNEPRLDRYRLAMLVNEIYRDINNGKIKF